MSVPLLRCNYQLAGKTRLETGIQWMRTFDRISENNSYSKTVKVAQIVSRDNYAGYNITIMFGINIMDYTGDINFYDQYIGTGIKYNDHLSEVFARIYAGL